MSLFLHIAGTVLLIAAGGGGGWAVCTYQKNTWQQLHTLSRLFRYMQELLSYQALSGEELLKRAGDYPEFAQIGVRSCCVLENCRFRKRFREQSGRKSNLLYGNCLWRRGQMPVRFWNGPHPYVGNPPNKSTGNCWKPRSSGPAWGDAWGRWRRFCYGKGAA